MSTGKIRFGFLHDRVIFLGAAILGLASCGSNDDTPPPTPTAQTWFFSDGAALTAGQVGSFDVKGLYFNAHTDANPGGEIRGRIVPSATLSTDSGSPATSNTFSTLMSGDQETPVNSSAATGYATIVLDPAAKTISGVLITHGILGTAAHIHDGAPGAAGPIVIPLAGGPTVWTLPAGTAVTDDQIVKLKAGAFYVNAHTAGAPGGEIRGQLTQQLRFSALRGANEVPAVTSTATATGVLGLDPTTGQIRGFVRTKGITGTVAHIHEAGAGVAGPVIIPLTQTPAGSGLWTVPAGRTLSASQVASFNAGNLYFNVHSAVNPGGELRGQIVAATLKIGNAVLDGTKEVPPVATTATGTGVMVLNSITGLVQGNLNTVGIDAKAAHVHEAAEGTNGPIIVPLTLTPAPSTLGAPPVALAIPATTLANGALGSPYRQSLAATGGTAPYTWDLASGTPPAGLNLSAAGVISGTPGAEGSSSFTVRVTDSAAPAGTASLALSLTVTASAPPVTAVLFSSQIQPILTNNCTSGCHSPGGISAFMNLTAGNAYASLVPQRVTAGNSVSSLLYQRVSGAMTPQMPLGRTPLSNADQALIKTWIDQGALNN